MEIYFVDLGLKMAVVHSDLLANMQGVNGTTNNLGRKQHEFSRNNLEKCEVFMFIPP